jgi:peptidoglycan L-alanyl-D-glutamate endopeptidase CwlK
MTLAQSLAGSPAPPDILASQTLLSIPFIGFDGQTRIGELVVHRDLASEVSEIFSQILLARFPIEQMIPVVAFAWSDDASMSAGNCSAFNFRVKVGKTQLSAHATGRAIDINPRQNPYINGDLVLPGGTLYNPGAQGTLTPDCAAVQVFEKFGWTWGGRWTSIRDYHHFEKPHFSP